MGEPGPQYQKPHGLRLGVAHRLEDPWLESSPFRAHACIAFYGLRVEDVVQQNLAERDLQVAQAVAVATTIA